MRRELSDLIRAIARQDWDAVDRLLDELNYLGWEGWPQALAAAFEVSVARRFRGQSLQQIADFVRETRALYQEGETLPALEMEGMIRAVLGETHLVDSIDSETALSALIVLLGTLLPDFDFTEAQLEEFLKEVEELAAEHM
ncbi:hypothetical protein [Micromonospora polyrhachis]|uniref:Uncharacterized protein n=1 Tax=Micromonospora polyrhachis TaxID=1282883 RepID=A0A7W7WNI8_9ACTN|nr:hypothetical protein [Micromonospora polyrhachis]MBB4957905.1 hypothetical protein [Micromonospora polyrhachis]